MMVLDYIRDNLDGKSWEQWCDDCYRDRYQQDHYTKIPPSYEGDTGIEGFTNKGVVYQCYCPEKVYTDDELYKHQRKKVTTDIAKILDRNNAPRILELGVPQMKEWHFVVPEYKDKRILRHLESKRKEVVATIGSDPKFYSYISPEIKLVIKTAEDFKVELVRLIRNPLVDIKLNLAVQAVNNVDWTTCEADKIGNIKRKIKAIMNVPDDDDDYKEMVKYWAEAYLAGIELMNQLQASFGPIYEQLFELEQQYKKEVSAKSKMNLDRSVNYALFNQILDEFEKVIFSQFTCFSFSSILELKRDLVSGWLADCSLQFKVGV